MSDVYDVAKRSAVMKRVRSSGNKSTELKMIEIFNQMGLKGWKWLFLLMVVFGMVMIAEILVLSKIQNIGRRSVRQISNMIKKLPRYLRTGDGKY